MEAGRTGTRTNVTLEALRDPHVFDAPFGLDEDTSGLSGMTVEHLRPLLDKCRDLHALFLMEEQLAQGMAPKAAVREE